jgi:hypothetical protein
VCGRVVQKGKIWRKDVPVAHDELRVLMFCTRMLILREIRGNKRKLFGR